MYACTTCTHTFFCRLSLFVSFCQVHFLFCLSPQFPPISPTCSFVLFCDLLYLLLVVCLSIYLLLFDACLHVHIHLHMHTLTHIHACTHLTTHTHTYTHTYTHTQVYTQMYANAAYTKTWINKMCAPNPNKNILLDLFTHQLVGVWSDLMRAKWRKETTLRRQSQQSFNWSKRDSQRMSDVPETCSEHLKLISFFSIFFVHQLLKFIFSSKKLSVNVTQTQKTYSVSLFQKRFLVAYLRWVGLPSHSGIGMTQEFRSYSRFLDNHHNWTAHIALHQGCSKIVECWHDKARAPTPSDKPSRLIKRGEDALVKSKTSESRTVFENVLCKPESDMGPSISVPFPK